MRIKIKTIAHNSLSCILLNGEYDEDYQESTGEILSYSTLTIESSNGLIYKPVIIYLDDFTKNIYTIPIEDFIITKDE